jgi:CheY-like chemotaxis protein
MLGHELRNPLGAIASAAVLLNATSYEESAHCSRLLDIVKRQTRVITKLLDDMLDVSRITHGKIDLKRCHVDLGDAVHQVADGLAKEANARQHVLEVCTSGDLQAFVDPMRIEQIVTNLLINAIKYTDCGGHIVVSVRRESNVVVVSVRDNGPGIDNGFLPYVFDLFSQGGATCDRAHGGLGLGLTLVRRLAEAHGGHVEVRSDGLGKGSEFLVTLLAAEPSSQRGGSSPCRVECARDIGSRPLRVLVVDDEVDSAALIGEILTLGGHEVHVVNDPVAALDAAAAFDWNLILLDIGLPGIDGYEVTRRMRVGRAHRARIVAVSGFGGAPDRQRSLAAGCDEHLLKPVSEDDLREVLARAASAATL